MSILTDNKLKLDDVLDNQRVSDVGMAVDQRDFFRLHELLDPLNFTDIIGFFTFVDLAAGIFL